MKEKIKEVGTYILGLAIFICILAIPALFIWGSVWLSTKILPWLNLLSLVALAILILVLLPLSIFRKARSFSGTCMVFASYIFGVNVWFSGLLLTYVLWGGWAVFIGLFLMGIGVVPIAMLATLFKAMWLEFGSLIFFTLLTFGVRILGYYLVEKAEQYSYYEAPPNKAPDRAKKKILFVDDDDQVVEMMVRALPSFGYDVDGIVFNGVDYQTKIRKIFNTNYDVLLMDISLPLINGIDFTRWIREKGIDVPIILHTAWHPFKVAVESMRAGADDLIIIPCELEYFNLCIEKVLEQNGLQKKENNEKQTFIDGKLKGWAYYTQDSEF